MDPGINKLIFWASKESSSELIEKMLLGSKHQGHCKYCIWMSPFSTLFNIKVYIHFIVDNFSRAILNWKASVEYSSSIAMNVLKESISKHDIRSDSKLITVGGPENPEEVSGFVAGNPNINQLIAQ